VPELRWTEPEWLAGAEAWIRERVDVTGELDQALPDRELAGSLSGQAGSGTLRAGFRRPPGALTSSEPARAKPRVLTA